jgi:hypothetical protein
MVKYLIAIFLDFSCSLLEAQTFKPFKVVITAGYAFPSGDYIKGGLARYLDAQYAINDQVSFGLSGESAPLGPSKPAFNVNERFLSRAFMYTATWDLSL